MAQHDDDGTGVTRREDDGGVPDAPLSPAGWLAQNATFLLMIGLAVGAVWHFHGPTGVLRAGLVGLGLGLVIFVHELGHFLAAKWCDVHVKTFSIGFGPSLPGCSFRRGETTYMLGILPLGGYVMMVGEGADEEDDSPRSFKRKTVFQRMLIISAGVIMNILLGLVCLLLVFRLHGLYRTVPTVWQLDTGGSGWEAGMQPGSRIDAVGGNSGLSFEDIRVQVALTGGGTYLDLKLEGRDGSKVDLPVMPRRGPYDSNPVIGMTAGQSLRLPDARQAPKGRVTLPGSAAEKAVDNSGAGFEPGDVLVGMSQPGEGSPMPVTPLKDFFDWRSRLMQLAGKPVVVEVSRADGSRRQLTVPPSWRVALPATLAMGPVAAVRAHSPAVKAGMLAGDRITRLRVTVGKAIKADLDLVKGPTDPSRLRGVLVEAVGASPALVEAWVNRKQERVESQPLPEPLRMEWDASWNNSEDVPMKPDSPQSVPQLGFAYRIETIVAAVPEASPLRVGDVIVKATWPSAGEGQKRAPKPADLETRQKQAGDRAVTSRYDQGAWFLDRLAESGDGSVQTLTLNVRRGDAEQTIEVPCVVDTTWPRIDRGLLLMPDSFLEKAEDLVSAAGMGWRATIKMMQTIYMNLLRLITRDLSTNNLGGPIEIAAQAFSAAEQPIELIMFLGMISINLAVVNFLPIPILDGGHMVFLIYEAITRRPPPAWVSAAASYVGLAIILSLFILVFYNDINRNFLAH